MRERESKSFDMRLEELKEKYEASNDFDFITILDLEDEYSKLAETNPEHTKRRQEILRMRYDLTGRLKSKSKSKPVKKDMYIDVDATRRGLVYFDSEINHIPTEDISFENIVDSILRIIDISFLSLDNVNIYI